jgi:cytoskeletal protein CcmA (bactofilin family)
MKRESFFTGRETFNAFLGEGTSFAGVLTFEGTVRIDGKMEGEIITKDTLVVGETATVSATIHAGVVVLSGTVRGDIIAEKKVEILATGKLFGNITTPSLSIEDGVLFEGTCSMSRARENLAHAPPVKGEPTVERFAKKDLDRKSS